MEILHTTVDMGREIGTVDTADYAVAEEELDFDKFDKFVEEELADADPSTRATFTHGVVNGLTEAYSNNIQVTLSTIIAGMHTVIDGIEAASPNKINTTGFKIATRIANYALALMPGEDPNPKSNLSEMAISAFMFQGRELIDRVNKV